MLPAAARATKTNQNAGASRDWKVSVNHDAINGAVPPKIADPVVTLKATPEYRHFVGKKEAISGMAHPLMIVPTATRMQIKP